MQPQNFENKVQQKMEELSFTPSPPVWQKIEEELKRKREKRRVLFWIWPLLLIGTGVLWFNTTKHNFAGQIQPSKSQIAKQEKEAGKSRQVQTSVSNHSHPATPHSSRDKENTITFSQKSTSKKVEGNTIQPSTKSTNAGAVSAYNKIPFHLYKSKNKNASAPVTEHQELSPSINSTEVDSPVVDVPDVHATSNNSSAFISQDTVTAAPAIAKNKDASKTKQSKKWKTAFEVGGGISGLQENAGSTTYAYASPSSVQSGTGNYVLVQSSKPAKGPSFKAGITFTKNLTHKGSFFTGLQYHYYSTYSKVGQQVVDSSALFSSNLTSLRLAYSSTQQSNIYHNAYHFIELPVGYQYLLGKKLRVEAGVALTELIASNALQYNPAYKIYRIDNSLLHKTGWNVFGSIAYQVQKQAKWNFSLGPQVEYGLRNLQKNNAADKQHLFFGGLKLNAAF